MMTALETCLVEFAVVLTYYRIPIGRSIEAALWGSVTMWSVFLLLWSGQIFGHTFRATGLIKVLVDSIGSMFPTEHRKGRALAMVTILSGFVGTFNIYAVYPVVIPGLADLGFDGIQAAAGYLIYASWCIPFAGLFIGAVIASSVTELPVSEIVHSSGIIAIPLVFVSMYGMFKILKFRFFDRESQLLYWSLSMGNVAGIVLFTQVWPAYHVLTLISGATFAVLFLLVYGGSRKNDKANKTVTYEVAQYDIAPDSNKLTPIDIIPENEHVLDPTQLVNDATARQALNEIVVDEGVCSTHERLTAGPSQLATRLEYSWKDTSLELSFVQGRCRTYTPLVRAYAPLLIAISYAIAIQIPFISRDLERLEFNVSYWGFNTVRINFFSAPAFPIFVAVVTSYLFRVKDSNFFKDLFVSTRRGASSLITLVFSSATVYLMLDTRQIDFLARAFSNGGRIVYELIDPALVFIGGMAFGQGAPAILLFSRIQIASAALFGFRLALLVGLVNVVAMGPTNAVKPPLIRFATSLVNKTDCDREIFRIGIYWGLIQVIMVTVFLFLLGLLWS